PPQVGDEHLQPLADEIGRVLRPRALHEDLGPDDLVCVEQQIGEDGALLRAAQRERRARRAPRGVRRDGSKDLELELAVHSVSYLDPEPSVAPLAEARKRREIGATIARRARSFRSSWSPRHSLSQAQRFDSLAQADAV